MTHEVEKFVYRKEEGEPWHGLGKSWEGYLSPQKVRDLCELNWEAVKCPNFYEYDGQVLYSGTDALVRNSDGYILDTVSQDWEDVPNKVAFEFFDEYCQSGEMHMSTAGSLQHGRIVFALAKINESFELFKGKDRIDSYLLFTNPHKYGWSTSVSMTAIRVVCMNTLKLSLGTTAKDKIVRVTHRNEFDPEQVKTTLQIAKNRFDKFKENAEFLAKSKASRLDIVEYFKELFPVLKGTKTKSKKTISKAASRCLDALDTQPGAEFANGTWWNAYNSVSFYTDHRAGRTVDSRMASAWYGVNAGLKTKALKRALELAS